jgi:hypothetical protein
MTADRRNRHPDRLTRLQRELLAVLVRAASKGETEARGLSASEIAARLAAARHQTQVHKALCCLQFKIAAITRRRWTVVVDETPRPHLWRAVRRDPKNHP